MYTEALECCIEESLKLAVAKTKRSSPWFEAYRQRHGIAKKGSLDREIFLRMYGREPASHEIQKIRFWRLGQHLPGSREEGLHLGKALELTGEELDRFVTEELGIQKASPVDGRSRLMYRLLEQYLCWISYERMELLHIRPGTQKKHIRHIFYTDALDCLAVEKREREYYYREHLYSRNFAAEFQRYFQEETIISRENMIRMLILLLMPDIDSSILSEWLVLFGYSPLDAKNKTFGYMDYAVDSVLGLCAENGIAGRFEDKEQMKQILRSYDRLLKKWLRKMETAQGICRTSEKQWLQRLRFMKFRSMDNV